MEWNCTITAKKRVGQRESKKPDESQKAKALWKMKVARDSGDDFLGARTERQHFGTK